MKNVLTLTLIAGSRACPNNCPICISKMTPFHGIGTGPPNEIITGITKDAGER